MHSLVVPYVPTARSIIPKTCSADPHQKKSMIGSAHFIPMHQTTAPRNVLSGAKKITKVPMKIVAIGKSWEKAYLAKDVSYEVIPCTIVQPCPPNAPSANFHMPQYYSVRPHNRNSTQ